MHIAFLLIMMLLITLIPTVSALVPFKNDHSESLDVEEFSETNNCILLNHENGLNIPSETCSPHSLLTGKSSHAFSSISQICRKLYILTPTIYLLSSYYL